MGEINMRMKVNVTDVAGENAAMFGMGLSHGLTSLEFKEGCVSGEVPLSEMVSLFDKLERRVDLLAGKGGGHNKFLESIIAWVLIKAPRYWWQEMDTYRHLSKQSESTMHTITKRVLTQEDFVEDIYPATLDAINNDIGLSKYGDAEGKEVYLRRIKRNLPEGFLQCRMVRLDMMTLQNMYRQRKNHRLAEWQLFFKEMESQLSSTVWKWVTS